MAKVESIGVAMILKTGIKVAQYYTVLKYGPLRPQNNVKSQDRTIVSDTGVDLETTTFLPGNSKEKVGKEIPPICVAHGLLGNIIGRHSVQGLWEHIQSILERFIKPRASTIFGHPV